jgi:hypothetical protein
MAEPDTHEKRLAALMRSAQAGDADAYVALMQELAVRVRQIVRHRRAFLERADVEDLRDITHTVVSWCWCGTSASSWR